MDYVTFSIIIDDIVFHDGSTRMGVLGGGGPQAAFGMRLWSESVGISAGVGNDLPETVLEWMQVSGIDLHGLRVSPTLPTPRAWQVVEADDRRTQVWRMSEEAVMDHQNLTLKNLPDVYRHAKGYHIGIHPTEIEFDFLQYLGRQGSVVCVEPYKPADQPPSPDNVKLLVQTVEIFSPNVLEASSLVGGVDPIGLLQRLLPFSPRVIALRMGSEGSIIMDGRSGTAVHVPAVPVKVVDPVGAGNAYCGGFLVGWTETKDLAMAGLYGAVAASFLVEQVGVPPITPEVLAEARRRFEQIRFKIQPIQIK